MDEQLPPLASLSDDQLYTAAIHHAAALDTVWRRLAELRQTGAVLQAEVDRRLRLQAAAAVAVANTLEAARAKSH